jgi:hypothetical protein
MTAMPLLVFPQGHQQSRERKLVLTVLGHERLGRGNFSEVKIFLCIGLYAASRWAPACDRGVTLDFAEPRTENVVSVSNHFFLS